MMVVQMRNICKSYPLGKEMVPVLKNVSLDVEEGVIRAARISGDFLAVVPCTPAEEALRGAPFERASVAAALAPLDLPPMLGGMGAEELLSLMF